MRLLSVQWEQHQDHWRHQEHPGTVHHIIYHPPQQHLPPLHNGYQEVSSLACSEPLYHAMCCSHGEEREMVAIETSRAEVLIIDGGTGELVHLM